MRIAENQLLALGISSPEDIDIEAIAMAMGAFIKYESQASCEASITGYKDRAIIRVDPNADARRIRFSAAHECGHWELHKGREFRCRTQDISYTNYDSVTDPEKQANEYAASLLLPKYLFLPMLNRSVRLSFDVIRELSDIFKTSFLATAIRAMDLTSESAVILCISQKGQRKWFRNSKSVPEWCWTHRNVDAESFAADILSGKAGGISPKGLMSADTWLTYKYANSVEIFEESILYGDTVLTLLTRLPEA